MEVEQEVEQPGKRPSQSRGEQRRWMAVAAYLVLLALTFATISDRRWLLFSVSVLLVLMGLTLFRPLAEGVPAPWNRPADLAAGPMAEASAGALDAGEPGEAVGPGNEPNPPSR